MEDLTKLSDKELQEELKRRDQKKNDDRKAYKELVNENLPQLIDSLKTVSLMLSANKLAVFEGLKTLLEMKEQAYDVKSTQQSHTFSDNAGNTIIYGFRVLDNWDDSVTAGIDKVRQFIASLAKDDATTRLVHVVNKLLKQDAKGNLKASRVLELTKLAEEFNDNHFSDAVEIIRQAYKPQRSAFFIEASQTNSQGNKVSIPLSITSVDFPEGTIIDDLFPVHEKYGV